MFSNNEPLFSNGGDRTFVEKFMPALYIHPEFKSELINKLLKYIKNMEGIDDITISMVNESRCTLVIKSVNYSIKNELCYSVLMRTIELFEEKYGPDDPTYEVKNIFIKSLDTIEKVIPEVIMMSIIDFIAQRIINDVKNIKEERIRTFLKQNWVKRISDMLSICVFNVVITSLENKLQHKDIIILIENNIKKILFVQKDYLN